MPSPADFSAATGQRSPFGALLATYLRPQWRAGSLLGVLMFAGIALQLVRPLVLGSFIDGAAAGAALDALIWLALLYLGLALAAQVAQVGETYVAQNIGLNATNELRNDLLLHTLRLDRSFHNSHSPGELIERVDGDVALLGNFFSRFVVNLLGNGILLLGVLALLIAINWWVGLAVGGCVFVGLFLTNILRRFAVGRFQSSRQASADLFGYLEERLAGTEDIRASGAIGHAMRGLHARSRDLLEKQRGAMFVGSFGWTMTRVFMLFGLAAGMGIGAYLVLQGRMTIGTLFAVFNYTALLSTPIDQIQRQMQDLQQAAAGVVRVHELLDTRSEIKDGPGAPLPSGALAVEFDKVAFGYADELVLRDVSFKLRPGEVLGLLGRTGSGKTTITRLLFRLYDPTAGAIRLGGVDLREAKIKEVRRHVGMVTQDIQLFHASVRDNLAFFESSIPDARIVQVLEELGLGAWLAGLPQGLDTKLAPGSAGLSAGEAQLLAFARVFLHDPGLVILDEASSRLDPATEQRLERAVSRLLEGRSAIIIAHRLGTVQRADTIMILEDGLPQEYGARAALERDPESRFAGLLRAGLEEVLS